MKSVIKVVKTENSRVNEIDFDNIVFGANFSDHLFCADYKNGEWTNLIIKPFENMSIHPSNMALHYGQSIFEGMKASVDMDGNPLLLRPAEHSKRLNKSAQRMSMPDFPEDTFMEALTTLIDMDRAWIPTDPSSSLYIRPFMFAMDEQLGVRVSDSYRFMIITSPVGPYYPKPVSLYADNHYVRAAKGGVGEAKAAGNYAASLYPATLAKKKGYDQVLWLDANEYKYVQEVGTMNFFCVIDGVVITPITDGAILSGITRDSILTYLKDEGYKVEERLLEIQEIVDAHENGTLEEVFGTGTAAVVAFVNKIAYGDKEMDLNFKENGVASKAKAFISGLRKGTVEDKYNWMMKL